MSCSKKEKAMIVFSFVEKDPPFRLIDTFVDEPFPFKDIYKKKIEIKPKTITNTADKIWNKTIMAEAKLVFIPNTPDKIKVPEASADPI